MIRAAVFGAAGYIGGELLRLLLGHPEVELTAAVSSRFPGKRLDSVHPNLRSATDLTFTAPERAEDCDVVFLATPHRSTMDLVRHWADRTDLLVDLSGDFRLRDTEVYERYYGVPHEAPELLDRFVPGIPELHRDRLRTARLISVPGCMANAAILALHPLAAHQLALSPVLLDGRTGSSGSGASAGDSNLHAERSGALRVFAPATHRHEAEVAQHTGLDARMTATGVEAVRGVQVVCHTEVPDGVEERAVRAAYREAYADEPFVRLVAHKRGTYRYPEPKILLGSNYCDIGHVWDGASRRLVVVAALDNLVKGGAGNAVQSLNVRMDWPESYGLSFPGLHPV
ncbi:N-acetyl-gamma-glutamyl-phosphate reductase [Streptomyces sp. NBC_01239]|uniref:N-acetyl-gamma-glutamyl-phosphate reductase n=1 Tax=Streptomyces sp. NBC_01239 TaxID=2903792 RepID=UPI002254B9A9|nr:N-acetyl-gamma-glutamyl-phosphate reductase [Streptomyces sp. NBC_01239]MCX4809337.1 N-acetyl-gamma-glutamyl-phosphate reductase [Streptomyces sp. NBC_01239]